MTIEAPTGSGSGNAGKYVLNDSAGYAEGGFHESGGYTGNGNKYDVAGYFPDGKPYHKGEYVVAQNEMKNPDVVNMVRSIEGVRRKRTSTNATAGFAEGGYHDSQNYSSVDKIIDKLDAAITSFSNMKIKASVNYHEFSETKDTIDNIDKFIKKP